jgi:adenylate cyclase
MTTPAEQGEASIERLLEERTRELAEARDEQLATSEILRIISNSPAEPQSVFDAIARSAARLCDSYDVIVFRVDGDLLRLTAHFGPMDAQDVPLLPGTLGGRTVLEQRVIQVENLQEAVNEYPEGSAIARERGHKTTLSVPLVRDGVSIGNIQARRDVVSPFSTAQINLLQTLADQAVIAIENARMFQEIEDKSHELELANERIAEWNRTLEQRVQGQLDDLERIGRLKRFFSPSLCEAILSQGGEELLQSHRSEISVAFCDLRGFTAFSETSEPEEVSRVLQEYFSAMGEIIFEHEGTIERFVGDSIMVLFNDPLPCPEHELQAVRMAVAMQASAENLITGWKKRGHRLGLGIGIARGFATVGQIGFEGRMEYSATGTVANLAARLCASAEAGQILISQQVYTVIEDLLDVEPLGEIELKGFSHPVAAYNALALDSPR